MSTFRPARNIDDAWSAVDAFPLQPGDPRYLDCSRVRGDTLKQMKRILNRHSRAKRDLHLLFTGYRGNGKTTELYQLHGEIKKDYEVIYFDAAQELDINNLTLSDLLLVVAKETVKGMQDAG
jgi:predicted AAA+ superfamily ATPase